MKAKIFSIEIHRAAYWFDKNPYMQAPRLTAVVSRATGQNKAKIVGNRPHYYHCTRASAERIYRIIVS